MKKKTLLILLIMVSLMSVRGQAPSIQWQNTTGGSSNDNLTTIEQANDGGYILGGHSFSGLSGDRSEPSFGGFDYWVVKLDAAGALLWENAIGGNSTDYLYTVKPTIDGGYILGGYSNSSNSGDKTEISNGAYDFWIVKLDALGAIEWQNTIGGNGDDFLYSLDITSDGGYILGGYSNSSISGDKTEASNGGNDFWVVKIDSLGTIQWQNTIGGSSEDYLRSIVQTTEGGYILGGYSQSGISGDKSENSYGSSDYWVVKIDALGTIQWDKTFGGTNIEELHSVIQTTDGGFLLGGISRSGISGNKTQITKGFNDYWVVKLDFSGVILWQNTIGGSGNDDLNEMVQTIDGGYLLGGTSYSNISGDKTEVSNGGADYWIIQIDDLGAIQWQNTIGGSGADLMSSLIQTTDGGYILGGYSNSNISGDKTENSNGISDYWALKINSLSNNWAGTTDTDWYTASNWSKNSVPTTLEVVIIPDVSLISGNFPVIAPATTLGHAVLYSGASLTVNTGITLDGTFTNNNGTVTLKNGAYLDDFTNVGASYVGNITSEQLVTTGSGLGQRFFGSPISNGVVQGLDATYAGGANGQLVVTNCASAQAAAGSPYSNLFDWHEDAVSPNSCQYEAWFAINASTALTNGRGYSAWMNDGSTISFTGVPNTGNVSYGGSLTNSASGVTTKDGWHLLSNPYPSAIDASTMTTVGWESLQTYNAATGAFGGTFQPVLPAQNLAVMQGFVAKIDSIYPKGQALSTTSTVGNQSYTGSLAFEITVTNPIVISQLGAFDHLSNGFNAQKTVAIYNASGVLVPGLSTIIPAGSGASLVNNYRMVNITPVTLNPGTYRVVAHGFNNVDKNGNTAISALNVMENNNLGINYGFHYHSVSSPVLLYPTLQAGSEKYLGATIYAETTVASSINNSADFNNAMRVANNSSFLSNSNWYASKLNIEVSGNGYSDISYLYFNDNATANFDNQWDCEKRESDAGKPTLFTKIDSKEVSLNGNANNELGNQNFPLGLKPGSNGTFTLSFAGKETFPANTTIYVKDLLLNTVHNIENGAYSFTSNKADNADRFEIIFVSEVEFMATKVDCQMNDAKLVLENVNNTANRTYEISANSLVVNSGDLADLNTVELAAGNYKLTVADQFGGTQVYDFVVESTETIAASLEVSNTEIFVGEVISLNNTTSNSTNVNWSVDGYSIGNTNTMTYSSDLAGVYQIEMNVSNEDCTDSKIVTIKVSNKTTAIKTLDGEEISFYPNPVNNVLIIQSTKAINIEIVDVLGKTVVRTSEKVINLENLTTGVYFIKIYDEANKLIGTEKIVKK